MRRADTRARPRDLFELRRADQGRRRWLVDLVQPAIGGGRLDPASLAAIDDHPGATALRVSGLDQATFERLISDHGTRFEAIDLWKCPRIDDLTPLEGLPDLRMVSIFWNQRSPRLWDLKRSPRLTALWFDDFTRLHHLDDLVDGTSLTELRFGDAVWPRSTFETLEPLAGLSGLRKLGLHPKRIDDGRVQPLGGLTGLERLDLPSNLFTTEQVAWLRARLPSSVRSDTLTALRRFEKPFTYDGKARDVLLTGKRKPFLDSRLDAARITKHVQAFDEMVRRFREDPTLEPA